MLQEGTGDGKISCISIGASSRSTATDAYMSRRIPSTRVSMIRSLALSFDGTEVAARRGERTERYIESRLEGHIMSKRHRQPKPPPQPSVGSHTRHRSFPTQQAALRVSTADVSWGPDRAVYTRHATLRSLE